MQSARAEVGDQQFGAVGLDHGRSHVDEFAVDGGGIAFECGIIAETSAERRPKGVHPELRAAGENLTHAGLDFGGVFRPADLVGEGRCRLLPVASENFVVMLFAEIDDGHEKAVLGICREYGFDLGSCQAAFDKRLAQHSRTFEQRMDAVVELEALIDVHDGAALANQERLFERRDLPVRGDTLSGPQADFADRVERDVADAAATGRRAVDACVVHQDEHAVGGHFQVDLHDIDAPVDGAAKRRKRIFRVVAPVAAVRGDEDLFRGGIVNLGDDARRPVFMDGMVGIAGQGSEQQQPCDQ